MEQQTLVDVPVVGGDSAEAPVARVAAAGKVFRPYDPGQVMLLPPSLDEWLPAEHLARFVGELVEQHLRMRFGYGGGKRGPITAWKRGCTVE